MLTASSIVSGYGQLRAVDGVSLTVAPGEVVALLGQNGAGKSTVVRTLSGLVPTWSGTIELDGQPIHRLPAHKRARLGLGTVLEGKRVFQQQSVRQNLELVHATRSGGTSPSDLDELFPILVEFRRRRAGSLSGGQQQMLSIAQSLTMGPSVLVLDEPSAGLAPVLVRQLFSTLRVLADRGIGILLVEQLLDETLRVADRSMVLRLGKVVGEWGREVGAADSVRDALRHT